MSIRYIDINLPGLPDPRVVAWLEANNIDPGNTPAAQYIQVTDEHLIYQEFAKSPDGFKLPIHDSKGEAVGWQKQMMSAPLLSAPENHGLEETK